MTSPCIWEGICAKAMIDVCAVCHAVTLLLLWISLGWIKRERFILFFFFKMPHCLLLFDLQEGSTKETLLIKLTGFQLALLPARIVP